MSLGALMPGSAGVPAHWPEARAPPPAHNPPDTEPPPPPLGFSQPAIQSRAGRTPGLPAGWAPQRPSR